MATPLNASLLRGFAILDLITEERPEITAATVVRELGLNAATAHRFLTTLERVGALVSHRRGVYCLGYRMVEIGRIARQTNPLAGIVQPVIDAVAEDLEESAMAARLRGDQVVCVAAASAQRPVSVNIRVGSQLEPHATAHGKLWLAAMGEAALEHYLRTSPRRGFTAETLVERGALEAELARVRAAGYATNRAERESDIGAVAVPVFSETGELVLTLSIYGLVTRFDDALIERGRRRLQRAAEAIRAALYGARHAAGGGTGEAG